MYQKKWYKCKFKVYKVNGVLLIARLSKYKNVIRLRVIKFEWPVDDDIVDILSFTINSRVSSVKMLGFEI